MVITCPSCNARYKLPGRKIKGRGAKITCPRCSHVFVIFAKDLEADDETAAAPVEERAASSDEESELTGDEPAISGLRRVVPPGPSSIADGDSPSQGAQLPGGLRAEDIFGQAGPEDGPEEAASAPAPAGGAEPPVERERTPIAVAESLAARPVPGADLPSAPQGLFTDPVESAAPPAGGGIADLDFRAVGITAWKVKVAIGLVYDFNDVETLYKYMDDKRVTPEDQISFDGKEWTRIGDKAELEAFLRRTYEELASKEDAAATPSRPSGDGGEAVTPAGGHAAPAAAAGGAAGSSVPEEGSVSAFSVNLSKPPPTRRRKRKVQTERRIMGMKPAVFWGAVGGLSALCVFLVIGALRGPRGGGAATHDGDRGSGVSAAEQERLRQEAADRLQAELDQQTRRIREEEGAGDGIVDDGLPDRRESDGYAKPVEHTGGADERASLDPITPREVTTPEPRTPEPRTPEPPTPEPSTPEPDPATRDAGETTDGVASSAADSSSGAGEVVEEEDVTAEDWAMLGNAALNGGDCGSAIGHFKQAVGLAPGSATYNYKLGLAYHQCGNDSAAAGPLQKAAGSISAAQELLDEIQGG